MCNDGILFKNEAIIDSISKRMLQNYYKYFKKNQIK